MASFESEHRIISFRPIGADTWTDISASITKLSFQAAADAFEDLGRVATEASYTLEITVDATAFLAALDKYVHEPRRSQMHTAYRHKTRRRNRRR